MNLYEKKYKEALERAQQAVDKGYVSQNFVDDIFLEHKENKSERVRKGLIKTISSLLDNTVLYHTNITKEEALAWLEKQDNKLDADKVIAWLVANICDFEYYVKLFKKDFGLC